MVGMTINPLDLTNTWLTYLKIYLSQLNALPLIPETASENGAAASTSTNDSHDVTQAELRVAIKGYLKQSFVSIVVSTGSSAALPSSTI